VKRLRLAPEAELDLDAAHLWYHRQAPNRAAAFLTAVNACLATINDPTSSAGLHARRSPAKQNLTVQRLPTLLTDPVLATEIQTLVDEAVTRSAFARDWRNRRIAHSDLALAIKEGSKPLAAGSRKSVVEALDAIGALRNRLEQHFRHSTIAFEGFDHPGDAEALLYVIRDGLEAENARRKRLHQGKPEEGDFNSRPV
jgi:hypothetical protein